jgi:hypothetical protein
MALSDIRTAWEDNIFEHATVQAWTPNYFMYDVTKEFEKEVSLFNHEGEINFFVCLVNRFREEGKSGRASFTYPVIVKYHLEVDPDGLNYNYVLDRLETLDSLVISQLTRTWDGTIDFYRSQSEPISITSETVDGRTYWIAQVTYTGFKEGANT